MEKVMQDFQSCLDDRYWCSECKILFSWHLQNVPKPGFDAASLTCEATFKRYFSCDIERNHIALPTLTMFHHFKSTINDVISEETTLPHLLMCMLCPHVICDLTHLLEESHILWTSKRYFSCAATLLTTLQPPKRNELSKIPLLFITTVFHRALASCCSRKIEWYSWCRNTISSSLSKFS
jgi:hypothetical protein